MLELLKVDGVSERVYGIDKPDPARREHGYEVWKVIRSQNSGDHTFIKILVDSTADNRFERDCHVVEHDSLDARIEGGGVEENDCAGAFADTVDVGTVYIASSG